MKRLVGAVVLAAALAAPAQAGRAVPFSWALQWQQLQSPVEQESPDYANSPGGVMNIYYCTHNAEGTEHPDTCVYNATGCDWDPDDSTQWRGFGTVRSGESYSKTFCVIASGYDNWGGDQHRVQARVAATTIDVDVSFTNDRGVSYTVTPVKSGNKSWVWLFCERDMTDYGQPVSYYPVIPNSNGGTGEIVNYTVSATMHARSASLQIDTSTGVSGPMNLGC